MEKGERGVIELQIEQRFSEVDNLQDLIAITNKMRLEGLPIVLLNKYSSKRRKELASISTDIKIIPKKKVDMLMSTRLISLAPLNLDRAAEPYIEVLDAGLIMM